jgi:hypothetical protein
VKQPHNPSETSRQDRILRERVHDPYKTRLKLAEDTVCPQCKAVFRKGRWTWGEVEAPSGEEMCQACHRTNDDYPAGVVTLSGSFLAGHRDEILGLVRHQEELEKGEHPLHRIMAIDDDGGDVVIKTTDIHLPRRIGEAVESAYNGKFEFTYDKEGYFLRGTWQRDS